jgi:hypothetical protein
MTPADYAAIERALTDEVLTEVFNARLNHRHGFPARSPRRILLSAIRAACPVQERTCANCRSWDADDDSRAGGECLNRDSPMYRLTCRDDREPWAHEWGCTLWTPAPPSEER